MTSTFTKAVRYYINAECQTPLRTGGADGDTETILRDHHGRALIQGSSLAGALRSWLTKRQDVQLEKVLFGTQDVAGRLMISDGLFDEVTDSAIRPRLRINRASGSADDNGKFDVAHLCTGSKFSFEITWLGNDESESDLPVVEQMLSALHYGDILLGAQKTNGFGRVSLSVQKQVFDLYRAEDRTAWLEDHKDGFPLALPKLRTADRVVFTLHGQTDHILVRAAVANHSNDGSYTGNIKENGRPVIPGSSVKGAVRNRAALIADWKKIPIDQVEQIFGRESRSEENGIAGKIRFEDILLLPDQTRKISRIRIDRFTAGVIQGGLFTEEPICSQIEMRITVPADCKTGCALLVYALRDLGLGLYNLGSGDAIGRGRIHVDTISITAPDEKTVEITFDQEQSCHISDKSGMLQDWLHTLEVGS